MLSHAYNITIDCSIGAPGHGKNVVDGLNAVDKNNLFKLMSRIKVPEAEQGEMFFAAHGATV